MHAVLLAVCNSGQCMLKGAQAVMTACCIASCVQLWIVQLKLDYVCQVGALHRQLYMLYILHSIVMLCLAAQLELYVQVY